jgi:hypothetical protein
VHGGLPDGDAGALARDTEIIQISALAKPRAHGIVGAARECYAAVTVVLVTAPEAFFRSGWQAETAPATVISGSPIAQSAKPEATVEAYMEISNVGPVETGVSRLLDANRG